MTQQRRVPPLIIEWEPGSDLIGDFAWGGFNSEIVVRRDVADTLSQNLSGFDIEPIETTNPMKLETDEAAARPGKKAKMVSASTAVALCEMWVEVKTPLDHAASGVQMEKECQTCGFKFYKPERRGLVLKGVLQHDFFHLEEYPSWIFCSRKAKEFIGQHGYSNVTFRDVCCA